MSDINRVGKRYVLVTAAYNEERYIENVIKSIVGQTIRPLRWIIVSDSSTDSTDRIVERYAAEYDFIKLHRLEDDHPRNFAAQVVAINAGMARLKADNYDFIGNLDADVSFESTYFAELLELFAADPGLGLAGGCICECQEGDFRPRPLNRESSVAHAVQLFRRECFQDIGGAYLALPHGGPDWHAVVHSRMNGWRVRSFEELTVLHHRPSNGATGWGRAAFRQGRMDHSLGTHPLFEIPRLIRRLKSSPVLLYAGVRLAGFLFSYLKRDRRIVPNEFVRFLRKEEIERLTRPFRKGQSI